MGNLLDLFVFKYNRTDFHELNLDWLISDVKTLAETLQNFVSLNTIKYADPIQWNITKQYQANTVVIDGNTGTAYLSTKPVPSGVALSNTDYWTVIFTLDILSANQNITFRNDAANVLATFGSAIGDWLLWNAELYKVTRQINVNEAYVAGYNIERTTIENFIKEYITALTDYIGSLADLTTTDKTSVVNAINEVVDVIGGLSNLVTTDKSSIVNAINEVVDVIGGLSNLATTDKSSIVNAINEVVDSIENLNPQQVVFPEWFGANGDEVTDDTSALQDALNNAKIVCLSDGKNYLITSPVSVPDGVSIVGPGNLVIGGNSFYTAITLEGNNTIKNIGITDQFTTYDSLESVIYAVDSAHLTVEGVRFTDIHVGYCIRFDSSQFISIKNNMINECSYSGIMLINGCYDADIIHNYVYNCRHSEQDNKYPIGISGYFLTARDCARRIRCNYNKIVEVTAEWEGIDSHGVMDCEIIGNDISGVRTGIVLGASSTSANPLPESNKNIIVKNNIISFVNPVSSYGGGILVSGRGANADNIHENIIIDNNKIVSSGTPSAHSSATSCIALRGSNEMIMRNIEITNNYISGENDGITLENYGSLSAMLKNVIISNNDISGGQVANYCAISCRYIQYNFENINIVHNNIHDVVSGVSVRGPISSYAPLSNDMINYNDNIDTGSHGDAYYITTPRTVLAASYAYGHSGLKINDSSGTNAFWFCVSAGNWKAV